MEEQPCVDYTDISNLNNPRCAVSEDKAIKRKHLKPNEHNSNNNEEAITVIRKLTEKNQKRFDSLCAMEATFSQHLIKVSTELSAINEKISKFERTDEYKKPNFRSYLLKYGTPYFKFKESTPPDNADVLLLREMGDIRYIDQPKPQVWLDTEKKILANVIESEERRRQLKDIEIEMLKNKKQMKTASSEDKKSILETELNVLMERYKATKTMKAKELLRNSQCKHDWLKISVVDLKGKHSAQECQSMWENYLQPSINKGSWKKQEDEKLKLLVDAYEFSNWDMVAQHLGTSRSAFQCMCHYQSRLNSKLIKYKWNEEDDATLIILVNSLRKGDYIPWKKIAYCFTNCSVPNLAARWKVIDPDAVKGKFSEEEDVCLVAAVRKFGTDFRNIANHFPGRSTAQLQERYRSFLKFQESAKPWTPDEDRVILEKVREFGCNFSRISNFLINRDRSQVRHRYYRIRDWLQKHPDEIYPACKSGPMKIAAGPDELWEKVVNIMKEKNVKFREVNGEAIMDDESFKTLKRRLRLQKKTGPKVGYRKTFLSIDLEIANYFCCCYPHTGGRLKIHYNDKEAESQCRVMSKLLDFLGAHLKRVSLKEIENDEHCSKLDELFVEKIGNSGFESVSAAELKSHCSLKYNLRVPIAETSDLLPSSGCLARHGELPYINVCRNAMPPNQTNVIGIRSIMLWRNVLKILIDQTEEKSLGCTFSGGDGSCENEGAKVKDLNSAAVVQDNKSSKQTNGDSDVFIQHSEIWKTRFLSTFLWPALCSENSPNETDHMCCPSNEFDKLDAIKSKNIKRKVGRPRIKKQKVE